MREKKGLTQRKLAHDLGISQDYIPAKEANSRQAGPKLQQHIVRYFSCLFEDLFEVVLVEASQSTFDHSTTPSLLPEALHSVGDLVTYRRRPLSRARLKAG